MDAWGLGRQVVLWGVALGAHAQVAPERRNWFDDPFLQLSSALTSCPVPLGPFITEAERDLQSHARAERGTTCWLAGACARPNFYLYDKDVAEAVRTRAAARPQLFARTSIWITVRGRVVFVDGCVAKATTAEALDAFMREVPDVAQVVVRVRARAGEAAPYPVAPASAASSAR